MRGSVLCDCYGVGIVSVLLPTWLKTETQHEFEAKMMSFGMHQSRNGTQSAATCVTVPSLTVSLN